MSRRVITGEGDFKIIDGAKVDTREGLGSAARDRSCRSTLHQATTRESAFWADAPGCGKIRPRGSTKALLYLSLTIARSRSSGASQVVFVEGLSDRSLAIKLTSSGDTVDLSTGEVTEAVSSTKAAGIPGFQAQEANRFLQRAKSVSLPKPGHRREPMRWALTIACALQARSKSR